MLELAFISALVDIIVVSNYFFSTCIDYMGMSYGTNYQCFVIERPSYDVFQVMLLIKIQSS